MSFDSLLRPTNGGQKPKRAAFWPFGLSAAPPVPAAPAPDPLEIEELEDAATKELNECLDTLVEHFPAVEPEVFREMLAHFDGDSRLQVVIDALLNHGEQWIKGRFRSKQDREQQQQLQPQPQHPPQYQGQTQRSAVSLKSRFRSEAYKEAVKTALYSEFKSLSHSQIRAVLAERNYSYTDARPLLIEGVSKSWKSTFFNFFGVRKTPSAEKHPLVIWPEGARDSSPPTLRYTANAELNRELYATLIAPLLAGRKLERELKDRELADQLNEKEATEAEAMYDCECCYMSETFEHLSACDEDGHYICFRCIRHTVNEAIFGQGWTSSMDSAKGTLRCIASSASDCHGTIPMALVERALKEERDGEKIWQQFEERVLAESLNLLKIQTPIVQCPFCVYAEVDDLYMTKDQIRWQPRIPVSFPLLIAGFLLSYFPYVFKLLGIITIICAFLQAIFCLQYLPPSLVLIYQQSRIRILRTLRTQKFTCRSPNCGLTSCLRCHKPWLDVHTCFETEAAALRSTVERAMSEAIKRTCPACNVSFVKSTGCNKLTCVCGYVMCYVCREQIPRQGYDHFCTHFRLVPGRPCTECTRCDLYHTESEEAAVKRAAKKAEDEWKAKEGLQGVQPWQEDGVPWHAKATPKERIEAFVDTVIGSFIKWKV